MTTKEEEEEDEKEEERAKQALGMAIELSERGRPTKEEERREDLTVA
jgi:hypothetical protein